MSASLPAPALGNAFPIKKSAKHQSTGNMDITYESANV